MKKRKINTSGISPLIEQEVDEELDLHGMTLEEAQTQIHWSLERNYQAGFTCLRFIHGASRRVPDCIQNRLIKLLQGPWVKKIERYYKEAHNSGATIVILKPKK